MHHPKKSHGNQNLSLTKGINMRQIIRALNVTHWREATLLRKPFFQSNIFKLSCIYFSKRGASLHAFHHSSPPHYTVQLKLILKSLWKTTLRGSVTIFFGIIFFFINKPVWVPDKQSKMVSQKNSFSRKMWLRTVSHCAESGNWNVRKSKIG